MVTAINKKWFENYYEALQYFVRKRTDILDQAFSRYYRKIIFTVDLFRKKKLLLNNKVAISRYNPDTRLIIFF